MILFISKGPMYTTYKNLIFVILIKVMLDSSDWQWNSQSSLCFLKSNSQLSLCSRRWFMWLLFFTYMCFVPTCSYFICQTSSSFYYCITLQAQHKPLSYCFLFIFNSINWLLEEFGFYSGHVSLSDQVLYFHNLPTEIRYKKVMRT